LTKGEISFSQAARESLRRWGARLRRRRERAQAAHPRPTRAHLRPEFQKLSEEQLLKHFRERQSPVFFAGWDAADDSIASLQTEYFADDTAELIDSASEIIKAHRWPLLGLGPKDFGAEINWHRDPLSGKDWPRKFHADINLWRGDGSDIRVLWELNRLGHFLTLGRAFAVTKDEHFAQEFFTQLADWQEQNPWAIGANWASAMEVALRAINLLAAFMFFRQSAELTGDRLRRLLGLLEQHGSYVQRNLEYSYTGTSNHYLSNVAGLLWIGLMVPELQEANQWRDWAKQEILREIEKQILPDGADYEASTGYHRFVLELLFYSFVLCRSNNLDIPQPHWERLASMFRYVQAYLRPDGKAPLIGDTDGGQVMPLVRRQADDHGYLLALGAVLFNDLGLKPAGVNVPEEALWIWGARALTDNAAIECTPRSVAFPQAGTYVLAAGDLQMVFTAGASGRSGRASHGHNDALSIEVSACGRAFIVDPGSYMYTADLRWRHQFRSTAYHSTVQVDKAEQNSMVESEPFILGREAQPRVLLWESGGNFDRLVAEHYGYERLSNPIRHQRSARFDKGHRWWLVEDELLGDGEHQVAVRFHFDAGLEAEVRQQGIVVACDKESGNRLFVCSLDLFEDLSLEAQFVSRDYGKKKPSVTASWSTTITEGCKLRWALIPVCRDEDESKRLETCLPLECGAWSPLS